ncbi:protein DEHYDRATION-INDUCED 19 homolog 4 [Daucus carota subsp. sativus]|uniref:protein DEHYDRATION-INDUCED 19 homolog 4 n=1 Tax=Daucus carota subsp. sativus TaxID=79200 RepID=UPI0007EF2058|nr:PREDICTED: protein DEHYDRATION-INDUCED 19 homolog 4-like [Daucus carota subsp. sativus]
MDSDSWARLSTSARRYQFRSDSFSGGEEMEGEEGLRQEFLCPFCGEDFDMVGLCCHIDEEHMVEVKNGVCPVCARKVGTELVGHITMQHGSLLKVQRKRRYRRGGSNSTLSILRRELRDGNLQSLLGGSSNLVSSTNTEADSLLSSFICNTSPVVSDEPIAVQPHSSDEIGAVANDSTVSSAERTVHKSPLSEKDQEEKARRCEFVQGLLMSTMFSDDL